MVKKVQHDFDVLWDAMYHHAVVEERYKWRLAKDGNSASPTGVQKRVIATGKAVSTYARARGLALKVAKERCAEWRAGKTGGFYTSHIKVLKPVSGVEVWVATIEREDDKVMRAMALRPAKKEVVCVEHVKGRKRPL